MGYFFNKTSVQLPKPLNHKIKRQLLLNVIGCAISLANRIDKSLIFQSNIFRNRIDFVNNIMRDKLHEIGDQHLIYNLKKLVNKGVENVTSVQ